MDRPVRILYTGLDDENSIGGIETFILNTLSRMDRKRFQTDLLVFRRDGVKPAFYAELRALGCRFHFVTSRRDGFFRNLRELRTLFQRERYEIVHCHLNTLSYLAPAAAAGKEGCRLVLHSHNTQCPRSAVTRFLHGVNRLRLAKMDAACLAVSREAGEWMFGGVCPFTVLENGVDLDRFSFSDTWRKEVREEFYLGERPVILHAGAFRPQKNHAFLLRVFAAYQEAVPDAVLLLAGDGELREAVEEEAERLGIRESVRFAGVRKDVERLLSAADLFLFPSLYEGFPIALIEAEASGLPCVVSDSITRTAMLPELCTSLSLDAPLSDWGRAMRTPPASHDRRAATALLSRRGLGVREQVEKLEAFYLDLLER